MTETATAPEAAAKDQADPKRSPFACVAFDCPLPGVHTHSTTGSNEWTCCVHHRAAPAKWAEVTRQIRDRRTLFEAARRLRNHDAGAPIPARALAYVLACERRDLVDARPENLTARSYGQWLRSKLISECCE